MTVKPSKLAEHNLILKIASHFKIPKDEVRNAVEYISSGELDEASPVLDFKSLPNGISLARFFYPVEVNGLNLVTLIDYRKFVKSKLYEAFETGEAYLDPRMRAGFVMAIYLTGMVWIVYREPLNYAGVGGIFISNGAGDGFVIEPMKNRLQADYPKPEED